MAINCLEISLKIVMSHLQVLKPNLELLLFDPGDWAAVRNIYDHLGHGNSGGALCYTAL